jgi:hypothetical protein
LQMQQHKVTTATVATDSVPTDAFFKIISNVK